MFRPSTSRRSAAAAIVIASLAPSLVAGGDPCALEPASGIDGSVYVLTSLDLGDGPALYAGGYLFDSVTDEPTVGVTRLDGSGWSPVGDFDSFDLVEVYALAVFDDGTGPTLYAGGIFATAAPGAGTVARLNGDEWEIISGQPFGTAYVKALAVYDDGSGPALYAGGDFNTIGGQPARSIARWDGAAWSTVDNAPDEGRNIRIVNALAVHDDGTGAALYAGGNFASLGGQDALNIARWDGGVWSPLPGSEDFVGEAVTSLASDDDYSVKSLYVGGQGDWSVDPTNRAIVRWRATGWSQLTPLSAGAPTPEFVQSMAIVNDGTGLPELYASVEFPGSSRLDIVSWSGIGWDRLPNTGPASPIDFPYALASFDAGDGLTVYAGGNFADGSAVTRQGYDCNAVVCCCVDINQDGVLNAFDVIDFIDLFNRLEAPADYNGDRAINFNDVIGFLGGFVAGCP